MLFTASLEARDAISHVYTICDYIEPARKSMPFEQILGQERASRILKNALINNCLSHAYLFYGIEGSGRFTTACALSKALICKEKEKGYCGICSACLRIDKEGHPDIYVVRPQSRKGTKDWVDDPEMGSIRIEQVRELQRWIAVRGFEGGWRVVIFDGAEKMNLAGANALLKTLEEPPGQSLIILISPNRTQLLPTIVSRCQPVYFSAVPRKTIETYLYENNELPQENLSLIAALSQGSLGRAIKIDSKWVLDERRHWLKNLHDFLTPGEGKLSLIAFAEDLQKTARLFEVLDLYSSWYRDLLVYYAGDVEQLINTDYIEEITSASENNEPMMWISNVEHIQQAKKDLYNHFNKQLVIENLLLKLANFEKQRQG